jgi:hypothetical protein
MMAGGRGDAGAQNSREHADPVASRRYLLLLLRTSRRNKFLDSQAQIEEKGITK